MDYTCRNPLFSIVVPAFNSASFIDKCIESVLHQECGDWELMLVDDGSTDGTLQVCLKYAEADARVKVIHKENGGHTSARNEGLKRSEGRYVIFLDSDDWLDLNVLALCKCHIITHDPDIIVFGFRNIGDGSLASIGVKDGYYDFNRIDNEILDGLIMDCCGRSIFTKSLSAKCFRRVAVLEGQLSLPHEIKLGEDGAVFAVTTSEARSMCVDTAGCYNCFVRADSVSRTADREAFKRLPYLLDYLSDRLDTKERYDDQFSRYIVAKIYSAAQFVIRSGADIDFLNEEYEKLILRDDVDKALKTARFSPKAYKHQIKRIIVKHRLWKLIRLLDK